MVWIGKEVFSDNPSRPSPYILEVHYVVEAHLDGQTDLHFGQMQRIIQQNIGNVLYVDFTS